jgi:hypothetical protein
LFPLSKRYFASLFSWVNCQMPWYAERCPDLMSAIKGD